MANLPAYNWKAIFSDGVQTTRTNLVPNPSFEFNVTSWIVANVSLARITTDSVFGSSSMQVTSISAVDTTARTAYDPNTTAVEGQTVTASAYVKNTAGNNREHRIYIRWFNSGGAIFASSFTAQTLNVGTSWTRISVTATAPATTATFDIALYVQATNASTSNVTLVDGVLAEFSTTLEPYFDGTTYDPLTPPKYVNLVSWTGAVGNSTSTQLVQNWYQLPDIQTIDIFRGRRIQIDDYSIDNAAIVSRNPSGWTNIPKLGDDIQIYIDAPGYVAGVSTFPMFWGNIRNVSIDYGKVAAEDEVTVACEGLQAEWGRAQLNGYTLASQLTDESISQLGDEVGLETAQFYGRSTNSAITFTGNAFDLANGLTRTEEARMWAFGTPLGYEPRLWWFGRNAINTSTWWFTDGTATSNLTAQLYENIEFRSSADNYYNEVTITPDAVAAQTASLGVTPVFGWDKNTYDVSTTQALNHAEWVLGNFQNKNQAIASLTYTEIQQDSLTGAGQPNGEPVTRGQTPIATNFAVVFRGTTYYVVGEGIQISARPGQTRFTIFFSGRDQNAYFILNDAVYGTLDFNKLGF